MTVAVVYVELKKKSLAKRLLLVDEGSNDVMRTREGGDGEQLKQVLFSFMALHNNWMLAKYAVEARKI